MEPGVDWLNSQIDCIQSGKRPFPPQAAYGDSDNAEAVAMLRMAALLNSLRPGTASPDSQYINRLRNRVLAAAGTELAGS